MVTGIGGRDGRGGRDRHVVLLQDSGNEEASVKRSTTKESCPRRRKGGGGCQDSKGVKSVTRD